MNIFPSSRVVGFHDNYSTTSAANVQIRLRQYRSLWLKPQNKPAYLLGLKPCSLRRANLDQPTGA